MKPLWHVYRFHDFVAVAVGTDTQYLKPDTARALGRSILAAQRSIQVEDFIDSNVATKSGTIDGRSNYIYPRK